MSPNYQLDNRIAIITGGAGGIGKAICRTLAKHGAKVLFTDVNQEAIEKAEAIIYFRHIFKVCVSLFLLFLHIKILFCQQHPIQILNDNL